MTHSDPLLFLNDPLYFSTYALESEVTGGVSFSHRLTIIQQRTGQPFAPEDLHDLQTRALCCFVISSLPRAALDEVERALVETLDYYRALVFQPASPHPVLTATVACHGPVSLDTCSKLFQSHF